MAFIFAETMRFLFILSGLNDHLPDLLYCSPDRIWLLFMFYTWLPSTLHSKTDKKGEHEYYKICNLQLNLINYI